MLILIFLLIFSLSYANIVLTYKTRWSLMINNIFFANYCKYSLVEYHISNRNFEKLEIPNTIDKDCKYCSKVNHND
mgnify:CR=1 FL=1